MLTSGFTTAKGWLQIGSLHTLRKCNRKIEPRNDSVMDDLLWSDPRVSPGPRHIGCCSYGTVGIVGSEAGWEPNMQRGGGIEFGPDVTAEFLQLNQLSMIIRSHEGPDARELKAY